MGLELTNPLEENSEPSWIESYDIVSDRQELSESLVGSDEIDELTCHINVGDLNTIISFGQEVTEQISRSSDVVLNSMKMSQLDDSGEMLNALANIMSKFDLDEIKEGPKGLGRIFGNAKKHMDRVLEKYHTIGDEVDRIYVQLRKYETEIRRSNVNLTNMFEANVNFYHQLVKYVVAGEQGCRELREYIDQRKTDMEHSGDISIKFELTSLQHALDLLERRTMDLRTAENVAMQTIPMIKMMEFNNMNLVRKLNSAFIITLPVFKQALAQAIMLKRQRIQSDAMAMLDDKTNRMIARNAKNLSEQSIQAAKAAGSQQVQTATLEDSWKTIMSGIDETRQIQENARKQAVQDQARLERIKNEFNEVYGQGKTN